MTPTNLKGLTVAANDGKTRKVDQLGSQINPTDTLADNGGQHRITANRVIASIHDDWAVFDGLPGEVAFEIIDRAFDRAIAALRSDRRFAAVPVSELELILADARREAALEIDRRADDHVALDEIRDLASRGFQTDADETEGAQ
jgi:hypothetical protein